MSEPENFLERWSRRKREADDVKEAPQPPNAAGEAAPPAQAVVPGRRDADQAVVPQTPELEPKFDLASLPSIDSITAATDVRAFLTPGVPRELMNAALRRAWAADPAIRDFVGLAENAWDFTDPSAIPGFGELPAGYDIRKLVAEVFGELDRDGTPSAADRPAAPHALAQSHDEPDPGTQAPGQTAVPEQPKTEFVQDNKNIASHSNNIATQNEIPTRRKHGGALPQ